MFLLKPFPQVTNGQEYAILGFLKWKIEDQSNQIEAKSNQEESERSKCRMN